MPQPFRIPAILLPMPQDPLEEWRRLTTLYAEMGDIEIQDLADQINDLTPAAQQILRDEMKKRGIADGQSARPGFPSFSPGVVRDSRALSHFVPASAGTEESVEELDEDTPLEFSWKTLLCECTDLPEARALARMLMGAGIESWIERPTPYYVDPGPPKVLVAADQLEHARQVLEQPIPQNLLDEERELQNAPQYEIPVCPKCKAPDPTLESIEPSNNWLCESCGYTWSDPVPDPSQAGSSA
jgi:hypothetical protein